MQAVRALVARRAAVALPKPQLVQSRGAHVELGPRERELLAEDPALKEFMGTKKSVKRFQKVGNAVVLLLGAGFLYEVIYRVQQKGH